MKDVGTPVWNPKRSYWQLGVQRDGKRKWFYCSKPGKAGMRECEDKAIRWLENDINTEDIPTVEDAVKAWLEEVRTNKGMSAYRLYESHARNYIIPEIGTLRADRLKTEQQIQVIINHAYQNGVKGKPLSRKTLSNLRGVLITFLKYCRKCGYTALRPENLELPRTAKASDRHILQPDEVRVLFSSDLTGSAGGNRKPRKEWYIHAFRFHVLTGLRPGELIGLRWSDIKENVCSIKRSINTRGEITPGKNANARRSFVLPDAAARELEAQREMLLEHRTESEYVFPDSSGRPSSHQKYHRHLQVYCAHNSITSVCPYELRHTFISMSKALPSELVKAMVGHSDDMDTFGTYGHEVDGDKEKTARFLNETLRNLLGIQHGTPEGCPAGPEAGNPTENPHNT